jgi:branched-chain amino acid transport system substrate-binding protein
MAKRGNKNMDRRTFLKNVGLGLGAATVGTTFPKLVRPARAAQRDHILVGRPVPKTGPIAAFAESSPWLDDHAPWPKSTKTAASISKSTAKRCRSRFKIIDTGSDPSKAGEVGSKLILKDKIDMMYVSSTPATVNPVAAVCERYEVPVHQHHDAGGDVFARRPVSLGLLRIQQRQGHGGRVFGQLETA